MEVILMSIDFEQTPVDTIIIRSKLETEKVSSILLMLELKEYIKSAPSGYVKLKDI